MLDSVEKRFKERIARVRTAHNLEKDLDQDGTLAILNYHVGFVREQGSLGHLRDGLNLKLVRWYQLASSVYHIVIYRVQKIPKAVIIFAQHFWQSFKHFPLKITNRFVSSDELFEIKHNIIFERYLCWIDHENVKLLQQIFYLVVEFRHVLTSFTYESNHVPTFVNDHTRQG